MQALEIIASIKNH